MTSWLRRLVSGATGADTRSVAEQDVPVSPAANLPREMTDQAELHRSAAREALRNKDFAAAAQQLEALVELAPDDIGALTSLGYVLRQSGRIEAALQALQRASALDEARGEPHYMLSEIYRELNRPEAAISELQRAIASGSEFWFGYPDLVELLIGTNDREHAERVCQQGLLALPSSEQLLLLSANLAMLGHDEEAALVRYQRVLEIVPGNIDARIGLGLAMQRLGHHQEGLAEFKRCFTEAPGNVSSRWAYVMGQLPPIIGPCAHALLDEQPFLNALEWFSDWCSTEQIDASTILGKYLPFLLAYREENHRELLSAYGAMCASLATSWQKRLALPEDAVGSQAQGRFRIGLVSPFFSHHSVWHAILKGWIRSIDRDRFELIAFHLSPQGDDETQWARQQVDRFEEGAGDASSWAGRIAANRCDALIYGSIGMDELSSQLANLRLAPVQALTWGHPETSGLPSLDYYISGDVFEPDDAQQAYSEKLVRLPHLGVNYPAGTIADVFVDLQRFGLDPDRPILICPGTPFKYSPRFDQTLIDIARRVEQGQLVFFQSGFKSISKAFRQRIEAAFQAAGVSPSRCHFVPWMSVNEFHGLMQRADVLVDTIGFSGFNTAIQAIECGLPIATLEGRYLRGRLASGLLRRMDMGELVVSDQDTLVELVARLATDQLFNAAMRQRITLQRAVLFDDEAPVRALEQFLASAIEEARGRV